MNTPSAGTLELEHDLKPSELPRHVAIIMDGNGRWAQMRGRKRIWGHHQGADSVREVARAGRELGIEVLTLYAFSEENWSRPRAEVSALMGLLGRYLDKEKDELKERGIRFRVIGRWDKLPSAIQKKIRDVAALTSDNEDMVLNLALSYSSRSEIVNAARMLAQKCADGSMAPGDINEEVFANHLYTAGLPDPDLLIRTSGEQRISNFLLWQISYTELVMSPVLWPDFRKENFVDALKEYRRRQRRFGRTGDQVHSEGGAG